MASSSSPPPNTLGNVSLGLGIASLLFVFSIGLCALMGLQQQWILAAATPLFVCGASSAFMGLLAVFLGLAGLFGSRAKATAVVGLVLGLMGVCLFFAVLGRFQ
jgi:hypothetical protein